MMINEMEHIQNISSQNLSPQNISFQNLSATKLIITKLIKLQNLSNYKSYQNKTYQLQNLSNYSFPAPFWADMVIKENSLGVGVPGHQNKSKSRYRVSQ